MDQHQLTVLVAVVALVVVVRGMPFDAQMARLSAP